MARVLGVDTSLRSSGTAVVEARGNRLTAVHFGCIHTPASRSRSECLRRLHEGITRLVGEHVPDAVAIEGVFFCKNVKTAVTLGEARGVVIAASSQAAVPVFEYSPKRVKQAVVGYGSADKVQVRRMVMSILGLGEEPQEDAGDALAIAICHLHQMTSCATIAPKPV